MQGISFQYVRTSVDLHLLTDQISRMHPLGNTRIHSQNVRMLEEGTPRDHLLQPSCSPTADCAGSHPGRFGISPAKETIQLLSAAIPVFCCLQSKEVLPHV